MRARTAIVAGFGQDGFDAEALAGNGEHLGGDAAAAFGEVDDGAVELLLGGLVAFDDEPVDRREGLHGDLEAVVAPALVAVDEGREAKVFDGAVRKLWPMTVSVTKRQRFWR
ncbi:hypothetical protein O0235_09365 [Tepidiforma flava]|uniref:Uncharacterized protein n=1 Tax=Tepidiforma flava TaxID=3004094 RepID=A0ABY7MAM7_9CHLR|nr:hypothetical protein [Tepidiforma flava]WBL37584.1 hypothetical protein O0235_09365 [Tepidiforma flava]